MIVGIAIGRPGEAGPTAGLIGVVAGLAGPAKVDGRSTPPLSGASSVKSTPRLVSRVLAGLALACIPACGPSKVDTSYAGKEPPHQGELVPLPGAKGYVEVVAKPGAGKTGPEYSFYFLKENYQEFSPAPSTGTLKVGKATATLKPGDGGALVTPPGQGVPAKAGLDGDLSVELDGKPVVIPLGVR